MMEIDGLLIGFVAGVAVAAPVGPIGLLCIRRTLADGRTAGLATGFGAATADAVYGLIAATGLAISGLLLSHATLMTVGGAILLALLGLATLRKAFTPRADGALPEPRSLGTLTAFGSTFVLTMANPATILTFIGLIAGLGASAAAGGMAPFLIVVGVFAGSAAWWLGLVHATLFVRGRITPGMMRAVDVLSGMILIGWGGWMMVGLVISDTA